MVEADAGNEAADPLIGTLLGGYIIDERIGGGGMGVVYRARDRHLKRTVAVKVLRPESLGDSEARDRFHREASSAAGIENDNVVGIYSIDIDHQGQPYIVMEYVDGPDLSHIAQDGPLEHERAIRIFRECASALTAVHEQGLVHRDVKPANVLIRHLDTPNEQAVLTDFGIVKVVDSNTAMTMGPIGTFEYMAPEVADYHPATARSDQYAIALVLYRMLNGAKLFDGLEMPRAHKEEPLPDLTQELPSANRALRAAIERALAKNPEERFPSVAAFDQAVIESQEAVSTNRQPLQKLMEEALADQGPLSPADLADYISSGVDSDDVGVTRLQIEGRATLYSQLFQLTSDGRLALRSP